MVDIRCSPSFQPAPAAMPDGVIISFDNVSKRFRIPLQRRLTTFDRISAYLHHQSLFREFFALGDISLQITKGETIGIIGPNGSGKSTLLKLVAGILCPDAGCVMVDGAVAPLLELGAGFEPELTTRDNIYLYGAIMGIPRKELDKKYWDIINFAELGEFEFMKLRNYSSGMYARLAFSIAIQNDPDILLLDEVLVVGDIQFQEKCMDKIDELRRKNKTILYVSHALKSVEQVCTRCVLIMNGRIISTGPTQEVIQTYYQLMGLSPLHPSAVDASNRV